MDDRAPSENQGLKAGSSSQLGDGLKLFDSPGSSIFDLPVQNDPTPQNELVVSPKAGRRMQSNGSGRPTSAPTLSSDTNLKDSHDMEKFSFIVISGGTGCNAICSAFGDACYVLPVSDDGGSSSEIIRVLGGPSIGACHTAYEHRESFYRNR